MGEAYILRCGSPPYGYGGNQTACICLNPFYSQEVEKMTFSCDVSYDFAPHKNRWEEG